MKCVFSTKETTKMQDYHSYLLTVIYLNKITTYVPTHLDLTTDLAQKPFQVVQGVSTLVRDLVKPIVAWYRLFKNRISSNKW